MKLQLGIYEHFKGKRYEVIGIAKHSETLEEFVVYKALYVSEEFDENQLWIRPLSMFFGTKIIDGKEVPRFKFVEKN
ncbi:MAG: DUF1653 domain-containing protein [Candidatus Nanoarchaeia archaeon]|nr:DUF1653 domain-containing protein [Candidatus Nanoarchaeia archaeon]